MGLTKIIIPAVLILMFTGTLSSQVEDNDMLGGPTVGFLFENSDISIGGNFEYVAGGLNTELPGKFGFGAVLRYWSAISNRNTILGPQANFHFTKVGDGKLVPFAGVVAGINVNSSTIWLWAQGGIRYFLTPNLSFVGRIGIGNRDFASPEAGLDFRF